LEFLPYLDNVLVVIAIILPCIYFIGFIRESKAYKIFTLYLTYIAIIQIILSVHAFYKINNLFLFSYYFIGQFIFMSAFYISLLKAKWIWITTALTLLGLLLQYIYSPSSFTNFNSLGVSITQSIIVIYAVFYYYKSLSGNSIFLLVNTGVLLYFLASILFFASGNLLLSLNLPKETHRNIGLVNEFLYLIFMILIFVEWYRNYRSQPYKNQ
tara:strand:- start:50033 stop:50668 length:636 start_codon:yes stop_codon:yes gene_type:complete